MQSPRITFGIIVLNGEPFLRYCLQALYPHAHQIIVVEGACPGAEEVAQPDGHSSDGTLHWLRDFQSQEDPEGKVVLVTAEDEGYADGFWQGEKDEMSQAYAKRATGNYLWQVDSDEFYLDEDIIRIKQLLQDRPQLSTISFKQITFWGGFDTTVDGPFVRYEPNVAEYHRLFKWGPGYEYVTHRPPTVYDGRGVNLRAQNRLTGKQLHHKYHIVMYHYSLVFPKQVLEKCQYYGNAQWAKRNVAEQWAEQNWGKLTQPYRVHNVYRFPSWLERYLGKHPKQILQLQEDLQNRKLDIEVRNQKDIDALLSDASYQRGRARIKAFGWVYWLRFQAYFAVWRIARAVFPKQR